MTISLNGHASASNVSEHERGFQTSVLQTRAKENRVSPRWHGGNLRQTAICPADFLDTLPEETPVRLVIPNESSALQIRATIGGISALAVVMPLNTDI